ncbi:MAG: TonB-dependent receptor plug domain-containing protein [Verrucomicrobia bacterium]|nr:TonB-dependent receptor plug domain-containing protein [Verrucomicrobiota bacterium]
MPTPLPLLRRSFCAALACLPLLGANLPAQTPATGVIRGVVSNPETGGNIEHARVSVEGTALEGLTDSSGTYQLTGVVPGPVRLRVFHTGYVPQVEEVKVITGQVLERNFQLQALPMTRGSGVVKLDQFVVAAAKEMSGAAIAIHTQRFAPNVMTVVAADEFGSIADGNVGEILKFLPGVTAEFNSGEPRQVAINGTSSANLPVTVNGFSLASAQASTTRAVELYSVSTNNLSRVEVVYSPTPESPGSALAGSINMVTQSAFDRARPLFTGTAFLLMRDNARDFHHSPAPLNQRTRKVNPGFDFSYVAPVNRHFGFTVSGSRSEQYQDSQTLQTTWRGASGVTNGGTLPDTTPDRPYLTDYAFTHGPRTESRSSAGLTFDFRLGPADRISLAIHRVDFGAEFHNHTLAFLVNRVLPGDFSTTHTRGFAGAGEVRLTNGERYRTGSSLSPSLTYRHTGSIWRAEAGLGYSEANTFFKDMGRGFFQSSLARRTGVTVSFADITYFRPGTVVVTDPTTGAPVDYTRIDTYALSTAGSTASESYDVQRTAYANVGRDFTGRIPWSLKAGIDWRESRRDLRGLNSPYTFVGADGRTSLAPAGGDDSAAAVLDGIFSQRTPGFGFPSIQWVDNAALLRLHERNPGYFTADQAAAHRNSVNLSKFAEEAVSSLYLRADAQFFDHRLRLTGGVRGEQTNVRAEGPLTDASRNFQRDAQGRVILGTNGQPLALPGDALQVAQRTVLDRGLRARKEYLRWFPSLNASYNLRENLVARGAHYWSLGRPDFNQYAGGLTLPNTEAAPSATNRITVNNAAIKAWSARSTRLSLEWYLESVGLLSVAGFHREIENFFGNAVFNATPEFLTLYGLDPAVFDPYDVATTQNVAGRVRMQGLDLSYRHALTFLPPWARGVQVFANASTLRALGDPAANFAGFAPRTANWGVSLARERFGVKLNWNFRSRLRQGKVADGRSIDPSTYNWSSSRLYLNVSADLRLRRGWTLFANLRNVTAVFEDVEIANPSTPPHAQLRTRADFGSLWSFGLRNTF